MAVWGFFRDRWDVAFSQAKSSPLGAGSHVPIPKFYSELQQYILPKIRPLFLFWHVRPTSVIQNFGTRGLRWRAPSPRLSSHWRCLRRGSPASRAVHIQSGRGDRVARLLWCRIVHVRGNNITQRKVGTEVHSVAGHGDRCGMMMILARGSNMRPKHWCISDLFTLSHQIKFLGVIGWCIVN
jgi:hypothetical protein